MRVLILYYGLLFFHLMHNMSKEEHDVGGSDSLYDLGDENFTVNKKVEVGLRVKVSVIFVKMRICLKVLITRLSILTEFEYTLY